MRGVERRRGGVVHVKEGGAGRGMKGGLCVCLSQDFLGGRKEGLCSLVDVRTPQGVVWESWVCFCFCFCFVLFCFFFCFVFFLFCFFFCFVLFCFFLFFFLLIFIFFCFVLLLLFGF